MRPLWIVTQSEFLRRVLTRSFLLGTLLTPFFLILLIGGGGFLGAYMGREAPQTVLVVDETGILLPELLAQEVSQTTFEATDLPLDTLRARVTAGTIDYVLLLPATVINGDGRAELLTHITGKSQFRNRIESRLNEVVRGIRLADVGVAPEVQQVLDTRIAMSTTRLAPEGDTRGSGIGDTMLGLIMGFLIYIAVFAYGSMVLQAVLEEKTSRVVEVMVSSVRSFDLLLGKVLGIGALGLVQQLVWLGIFVGGLFALGPIIAAFTPAPNPEDIAAATEAMQGFDPAMFIPNITVGLVVWFLLFFLGGYLLYASLFAAAGSAVDQLQDAQSFTVPLMIPVIMAIVLITPVAESPDSTLAIVMSMIPFFAPIHMVVRLGVTDVPFWQVALSYGLLVLTFMGSIWVSARIYRTGILLFGKKPGFKDLWKWIRVS